ncbi:hypothetical protein JIG36_41245 [Actinoplanes sp. LDG1-06]|uniref:Uncharacterized protein n=1 Tax=Paractinoplanes ovalisporus TaxID=2810368 RepID=A0ABS2AQ11_9ACTN|nr:DUF6236 family protein [Actinoplanes ovalisporus]MBM2621947.1 hypothetical protein [Actinoplanes ovalisporus]
MSDEPAMSLPRYGLYYPYIHFKNDTWTKLAALYWPRMARIVPTGHRMRDSDTVRALSGELGWTIDIPVEDVRGLVADELRTHLDGELAQFRIDHWYEDVSWVDRVQPGDLDTPEWSSTSRVGQQTMHGFLPSKFAGVYSSEFAPEVAVELIVRGFAMPMPDETDPALDHRPWEFFQQDPGTAPLSESTIRRFVSDGGWMAMQADFAWVYKCVLSETVAAQNRLSTITDHTDAHLVATGFDAIPAPGRAAPPERDADDVSCLFGLAAIRTVIPKDLSAVPVEKIIEVRRRYGDRFDAWRTYVDAVGAQLAEELKDVQSEQVLSGYLTDAVRRYAEAPAAELRSALTSSGLDTLDTLVNTKFEAPAAVAAIGVMSANPVVTAAGAGLTVATLWRRHRRSRQLQLASPHGYLAAVRGSLEPASALKRLVARMRLIADARA